VKQSPMKLPVANWRGLMAVRRAQAIRLFPPGNRQSKIKD